MPTTFSIDAVAIADHTARLLRLNDKAMPNAARNTINRAGVDVKQNTMPAQAGRTFTKREPNFLRANSRVEFAKGSDLGSLRTTVGFANIKPKPVRKVDKAVEDLEDQEEGGTIGGRSLVPLKGARTGGAYGRRVKSQFRTKNINGAFDSASPNLHGAKNAKEAFMISIYYAQKGGFVIGNAKTAKGARMLLRVNSVQRMDRTYTSKKTGRVFKKGNLVAKTTALYSVKSGNVAKVKATHFMRRASLESAGKMNGWFVEEAEKQIRRYI